MISKNKIYVIAEAGVNHNGNLNIAKKLIHAAKASGANAIKFQNFTADSLVTRKAKKAPYQIKNTKNNSYQFQMLKELELKSKDYFELKKYSRRNKIDFLSSVFDIESIFFLKKKLKMNKVKIPSGEITNFPLLNKLYKNFRKIYLSTGMSNIKEIMESLNQIMNSKVFSLKNNKVKILNRKKFNNLRKKVTILHCVTDYPVKDEFANLQCINTIREAFNFDVGYSDHTKGIVAPLIASSKGSAVIEKHLTLNRKMKGPDHLASLEPREFKLMVDQIRKFEEMNGDGTKKLLKCEIKNKKIARKSVVADKNILKGEMFTYKNLTTKRPGDGLCASKFKDLINKKSKKNYKKNQLIKEKI